MKTSRLYSLFLISLFAAGCTTPEPWQQKANNPPEHAGRVKIVMYDTSPRGKRERIDVITDNRTIQKPFKAIALLTCEGALAEEAVMTEANIYRARMMGADAVVIENAFGYQQGGAIIWGPRGGFGGGSSGRAVFRATAVVYE